jgi:predicted metal-dependent peptidase
MVDPDTLSPEKKMTRAKVKLYRNFPFFGYLTSHLTLVETEQLPTAGVDFRGNLYYNPEFIDGLTMSEVKGLALHEVLHLALEGDKRQRGRKHRLWNIAQDAIINHVITQEKQETNGNVIELPKTIPGDITGSDEDGEPVLPNKDGSIEIGKKDPVKIEDLSNESFESVYDIVRKESQDRKIKVKFMDSHVVESEEGESGQGQGEEDEDADVVIEVQPQGGEGEGEDEEEQEQGGGGEEDEDADVSKKDISDTEKDWGEILQKAVQEAKQRQGHVPGSVSEIVDNAEKSKFDWRKVIQSIISDYIPYDHDWNRPTRSYYSTGVYLPSSESEKAEVTVALDTSGSISSHNLSEFMGELLNIIEQFEVVDLEVIQHDADVHSVEEYDRASREDFLEFEVEGRGGTDHRPVFEELEEDFSKTKVLICFTDGYTTAPDNKPQYVDKVIWAVNNYDAGEERMPFGEIIRVHAEE